jgi:hypothetical protein
MDARSIISADRTISTIKSDRAVTNSWSNSYSVWVAGVGEGVGEVGAGERESVPGVIES